EDRAPDGLGIVLDPAWTRVDLREFAIHLGQDLELVVEQERGRAGRALVDGEDAATHQVTLSEMKPPTSRATRSRSTSTGRMWNERSSGTKRLSVEPRRVKSSAAQA